MEVVEIHLIYRPEEVSDLLPVNHEVRYSKRIAGSTQTSAEALQYLGSSSKRLCAVMFGGVAERADDFIFWHCMEMCVEEFLLGTSVFWLVPI